MATYKKSVQVFGSWVKAADLKSGMRAKIVSETNPEPSQFQNKDGSVKSQDVCKVKFDGFDEAFKVALNRATINGLVEAWGEDSADWQNKVLTVETEKMRVGGKAVVALYLIPAGFERIDDENGYAIIVPQGLKTALERTKETEDDIAVVNPEDDVNAELQEAVEKQKKLDQVPF